MYVRSEFKNSIKPENLMLRHVAMVSATDEEREQIFDGLKEFIESDKQTITYVNGCVTIDVSGAIMAVGCTIIPNAGFLIAFSVDDSNASGVAVTGARLAKLAPISMHTVSKDGHTTIESVQFVDEGVKR